jgi:hypothetical protein
VPAEQQRQGHRTDISDSEGSDADVEAEVDAAALLPAAEGVERALHDMAAMGWGETVAIESSEEEEEEKEEKEEQEEEGRHGQQGDEHFRNEGAGAGVAPAQALAAVDARDDTAAEAPPPAQSQPDAVEASASQPFSAVPTFDVSDVTAAATTGDAITAAPAQEPALCDGASAPQLASASKTQARAPLRRASHFYVQRPLQDMDEAALNEEKEKEKEKGAAGAQVRGHASACNASRMWRTQCVRGVTRASLAAAARL